MAALELYPDLLYFLPPETHTCDQLTKILKEHSEVRFVSFVGVDLAGNDTDEKIPIYLFLNDVNLYINTKAIHSDGSSVVLPGIAALHDGQIEFIADKDVMWFVDYNYENVDAVYQKPIGTLRIPSFLLYKDTLVCSRSILKRSAAFLMENVKNIYEQNPELCQEAGFSIDQVDHFAPLAATELEFWVSSPDEKVNEQRLSISESLKEHYWKRTKGVVRTAVEKTLILLEYYGFFPEMAHKEVGGVKAHLSGKGDLHNIMEQLEVTWHYSTAIQTADFELFARVFIKEVFRLHGLDVSFSAKPLPQIIGSGKHIHMTIVAYLKDGRVVNLFTPSDPATDYLSQLGWGALLGFLKHYSIIHPFISITNDSFARLQPGFEAPTHTTASIGKDLAVVTRNRTVLLNLVRELDNPNRTRFEIRSPDPHTNVYLGLSAIYQCMLDGIHYGFSSGLDTKALEKEFSKAYDEPAGYLAKERSYRVESDTFTTYSPKDRDRLFGRPPATVYESLRALLYNDDMLNLLCAGNVFTDQLLASYARAMLERWEMDLAERIIPTRLSDIRNLVAYHDPDRLYDETAWREINIIRNRLAKDTQDYVSIFTEMRMAIDAKNLKELSQLQQIMNVLMAEMSVRYNDYCQNQI